MAYREIGSVSMKMAAISGALTIIAKENALWGPTEDTGATTQDPYYTPDDIFTNNSVGIKTALGVSDGMLVYEGGVSIGAHNAWIGTPGDSHGIGGKDSKGRDFVGGVYPIIGTGSTTADAIESFQEKAEFQRELLNIYAPSAPEPDAFGHVNVAREHAYFTEEPDESVTEFRVHQKDVWLEGLGQLESAWKTMQEEFTYDLPTQGNTVSGGGDYGHVADLTVSPGATIIVFEVDVPIYYDDVTFDTFAGGLKNSDDADLAAAVAAQEAYNDELAAGINHLGKTGDGSRMPERVRPVETTEESIGENAEYFDQWWENTGRVTESALQDAQQNVSSTDDLYNGYVDDGGAATKEEWLDQQFSDSQDEVSQTDTTSNSWLSTLGDGLSWLGDSSKELLNSWGPVGISTMYATKKATDGVLSGNSNTTFLLLGGIALALLLN